MKIKNIDKLSGRDFEDLIEKLIQKMGFITEERKRTSDGGIDITALNEKPILKGKYIIQCKRYSKPVGQPVLRDLYGVVNSEHANKGILITNSAFTKAAKRFAENKPVELIDGRKLTELLDEYLGYSYEKKVEGLRVPEVYRVTYEHLSDILQKINKRREKVKMGLAFAGSKTFRNGITYSRHIQEKLNKTSKLSRVFFNQFNHLNNIWGFDSKADDSYTNIRQTKIFCRDLGDTLKIIEKEWEKVMAVDPPQYYEEPHTILCSMYDPFFDFAMRFVRELKEILNQPENFSDNGKNPIRLTYTINLEKEAKIFTKALNKAKRREKRGCFIATAVYKDPFCPEINTLCKWRDEKLEKTHFGRLFIAFYYQISPKMAFLVERAPFVQKLTKVILDKHVTYLKLNY